MTPHRPLGPVAGPFPARRLRRAERGQAIFFMLFIFLLLAGLLFLIINSGLQINNKVMVQSAADASTAGGAAWYARGLNTVSMCNVVQTQLLALVLLLDTLETVVPPAVECIDDLVGHIGSSPLGHDVPIDERVSTWLVVGNAASEKQIIHQFDDVVRNIPIAEFCRYDTGILWECAKLMEGFKQAMADTTPRAAQREAIDIATEDQMEFGFVLPLWPALPVRDGQFEDFKNPMRWARMPPPLDRQVIGGFADVMGYRSYGGAPRGPFEYWREPYLETRPMGLFDLSKFSVLFRIVSDMKFEMMFGSTDDQVTLREWEMVYEKAKELPPERIRRCWWERVGFDARYEFPKAEFFANMDLRHEEKPRPHTFHTSNMNSPNLSSYKRATQGCEGLDPRKAGWYRVQERWTAHYPPLGIFAPHPPLYPDGSPWPYTQAEMQRYWHVTLIRFNGAELETDHTLHRDYLPPAGSPPDLRPVLLDRSVADLRTDHVKRRFTFYGFAYRPGVVKEWTEWFVNPNPSEKAVGYAQARVYNRWSHDLFTQHWKVKLMRQDEWKSLLGDLGQGLPGEAAEVGEVLTSERILPVQRMIEAYDDPFVMEVSH